MFLSHIEVSLPSSLLSKNEIFKKNFSKWVRANKSRHSQSKLPEDTQGAFLGSGRLVQPYHGSTHEHHREDLNFYQSHLSPTH